MDPPMDQQSPKTPPITPPRMIEITVKYVMAGKPEITVRVPEACTVRGLKGIIAGSSEIFPDKQLLLYKDNEMRDDDAPISHYGITSNCTITMAVNMNTGVTKQGAGGGGSVTNVIFYVPANFPQDDGTLRNTLKNITTVKGKKVKRHKRVEKTEDVQLWTPEKQLEVELTRNRMKALMRKKNRTKLLSPCITPIDGGSVINSAGHSPTGQRTPNESVASTPINSREPDHKNDEEEVPEKEMKLFFEPMETIDQLKHFHRQKSMIQPPQSHEELEELKKKLAMAEKTTCKLCGKKVPPAEQTIRCRCKSLFCRKHRDPKTHQCKIDYKQTGRKKINQMMPKIGEGGARKGK